MCLNIVSDSIRLDLFLLNNNKLQNPTLVSIRAHWAFCVKRTCMWCSAPPPPPAHPVISAVVLFFQLSVLLHVGWEEAGHDCTLLLRRALWSTKRVLWNKPVANEISLFLQCVMVKSSSFTGFVQVLTTSCQKRKEETSVDLYKRSQAGPHTQKRVNQSM